MEYNKKKARASLKGNSSSVAKVLEKYFLISETPFLEN